MCRNMAIHPTQRGISTVHSFIARLYQAQMERADTDTLSCDRSFCLHFLASGDMEFRRIVWSSQQSFLTTIQTRKSAGYHHIDTDGNTDGVDLEKGVCPHDVVCWHHSAAHTYRIVWTEHVYIQQLDRDIPTSLRHYLSRRCHSFPRHNLGSGKECSPKVIGKVA